MESRIELQEDRAAWSGNQLIADTWNEYREGDPHRQDAFERASPSGGFCYWCAMGGECFALASVAADSCIASVESALRMTQAPRNEHYGFSSVYVIWQPKDHSEAAWLRWSKNWSKRTALRPA